MLLALDTSTRSIGIALYDGAQVLNETIWVSQDFHTVELAPAVANTMQKSGVSVSELQALAVAIGPGSFTGLRIGLGLAKGIAFVHQLPIAGVPTLDILAVAQPLRQEPMLALLRAGRGRFAASRYIVADGSWQSEGTIEVMTIDEMANRIREPVYVCGELNQADRLYLSKNHDSVILASPAHSIRRPSYLAELGWRRLQSGQVDRADTLAPVYLHFNDLIPAG